MSAYEPPTAEYPIFDSLAFQAPNSASLTLAEADQRYLARQNIATSNASLTAFAGDVTIGNTLLQQSTTTLNIDNQISGSTTNLKTKTAGGVSVTPLSISSTATTINGDVRYVDKIEPSKFSTLAQVDNIFSFQNTSVNGTRVGFEVNTVGGVSVEPLILTSTTALMGVPITLDYTTTPTSGQLGFRTRTNANVATAVTNFTIITLITGGFTLNAGTYLITLNGHMTITAVAGTVTQYELGLSTANNSFTGGFVSNVLGTYNVPALGSASVTGQTTQVFNVTPATAGTYFFNHRLTFAGIVPTLSTGLTYIEYTRIA
jgi:hypothetical protein